ncbi:MAG TPA: SRPBCC family protein [Flavisolibacter sp.]|nr:SRPBCC family protein [Flavisolibacter sp.]
MAEAGRLQINAALKIQKRPKEVFEAIVDPEKMSNYFISESSGRMEEGKKLIWKFPELDMEFPVHVKKIDENKFISFSWDDFDGTITDVVIELKPMDEGETFVSITEGSRENNEAGIGWLMRNTEGWANFLACLKAYLEYGINLRKGAFDISQLPPVE